MERAIAPLLRCGFAVVGVLEAIQDFGNTEIVLASDAFKVRLLSDRGQTLVDVARTASTGWFDLSEVLVAAGKWPAAGPWDTPDLAVAEFQKNEVVIGELLSDADRRSRLRARQ